MNRLSRAKLRLAILAERRKILLKHQKLISLIRNNEMLWNESCPLYHNEKETRKGWLKVAKSMFPRWTKMYMSLKNKMLLLLKETWRQMWIFTNGEDALNEDFIYMKRMDEQLRRNLPSNRCNQINQPLGALSRGQPEYDCIDNLEFISLVENHEPIWNIRSPLYNNCIELDRAWDEIGYELFDGWGFMSTSRKENLISLMVRKWNYLHAGYLNSDGQHIYEKELSFIYVGKDSPDMTKRIRKITAEVEQLLLIILDYEIVWNLCHPLHSDIPKRKKAWDEILKRLARKNVSAVTVRRKWQYIRRTLLKTSYIIKLQNSDRYPDIKYMRDTICFNYKVLKKNKCPADNTENWEGTLFASDDADNEENSDSGDESQNSSSQLDTSSECTNDDMETEENDVSDDENQDTSNQLDTSTEYTNDDMEPEYSVSGDETSLSRTETASEYNGSYSELNNSDTDEGNVDTCESQSVFDDDSEDDICGGTADEFQSKQILEYLIMGLPVLRQNDGQFNNLFLLSMVPAYNILTANDKILFNEQLQEFINDARRFQ